MQSVCIAQPDDWHVHFRDGEMLHNTVPATAKHFGRALVMPNLEKPLTSLDALLAYQARIMDAAHDYPGFKPYFTFYLNESISPDILLTAKKHAFILGGKLYPAGVTTNSAEGARSIRALYPLFEGMQASDLVLQIHGEVITGDIFEREALFIETHLKNIMQNFPKLRIVLEHISTQKAVQAVENAPDTLAATITPHHLLYDRNHLLAGGIRPHYYCLPILKHARDKKALQVAAISGNPKFFAGTDSAPHGKNQKECASGCAGIYSAPFALSMYAEVFESMGALDKLNQFLGQFGADFYQLPLSNQQITLVRESIQVPAYFDFKTTEVVPVHAGGKFAWSVR
jgi:dihydroorotase